MGKIFTGISIIAIWAIISYTVFQNDDVMSNLIPSVSQRQAFMATYNALATPIWAVVMLIGIGLIFWGIKD